MKAESIAIAIGTATLSIIGFFGLLLHEVTGPKVLFAMTVVSAWSDIVSTRMVVSTIFSAAVGWFVWWLQKRVNERRTLVAEEKARQLAELVEWERKDKARIEAASLDLTIRVTRTETLLQEFQGKIMLMDQTVRPLFEVTKLKCIEALTHPDPEFKIPDELLAAVKGPEGRMSPELAEILKERETSDHPSVTPQEKLAAAILPQLMLMAEEEAKTVGPFTSQIVTSPIQAERSATSP